MSHLTKIHHDLVLKSYFDYLNSHFIVISFKYFWPAFNICPQIDGKKEKKLVRSNEVRKKNFSKLNYLSINEGTLTNVKRLKLESKYTKSIFVCRT